MESHFSLANTLVSHRPSFSSSAGSSSSFSGASSAGPTSSFALASSQRAFSPLHGGSQLEARPQELVDETLRGKFVAPMSFAPEWAAFAAHIRSFGQRVAWEIFAGAMIITSVFLANGVKIPPVDITIFNWMNVLFPGFLYVVLGLILEGRFWFVWLAPPCASFSMALNSCAWTLLRTASHPEEVPGLPVPKQLKVDMGNSLASIAFTFAKAQHAACGIYVLEQPATSLMLQLADFKGLVAETSAKIAVRAECVDNAPWQKETALVSNDERVMRLNRLCQGGGGAFSYPPKGKGARWPELDCRGVLLLAKLRTGMPAALSGISP